MPGVVPNAAEVVIANFATNKATPTNLNLRLFSSNTTPAETDTAGTYTELAATGYASISAPGSDWTVTGGNPTNAVCVQKTFTMTAAGTVYGYYATWATSGTIAFAERFSDGPYTLPSGGGSVAVTVTWAFGD